VDNLPSKRSRCGAERTGVIIISFFPATVMFLKKTGSVEIIGITYFSGIYESNPLSPPEREAVQRGMLS
jgi:hypothetical protein